MSGFVGELRGTRIILFFSVKFFITENLKLFLSLAVPYIKIVQMVDTRWNSFALCSDSILRVEAALAALRDSDNDPLGFEQIVPTEREFNSLRDLVKPMKLIQAASERFQADEHPTIHMVVFHLLNIGCMSGTRQYQASSNTTKKFVEAFEANLKLRIPNYGRNINECCVANYLHPTFKGRLLHVQNDDESFDRTLKYIVEKFTTTDKKDQAEARASQVDMFSSNPLDVAMDESDWGGIALDMARAQVMAFESSQQGGGTEQTMTPIEREISIWRDATPVEQNVGLDILEYWRGQETRLPLLASLAKATLAIQVTSASSERVFSEGGNVVRKTRTLLNPDNAEMLVFIHDNYDKLEPFVQQWKTNIKDFTYEEQVEMELEEESESEEEDASSTPSRSQSITQTPKGKGKGKGASGSQSQSQTKSKKQKEPEVEVLGSGTDDDEDD